MQAETQELVDPFVPKCLDCGYELTSLPDGRCPECGLHFLLADLIAADRDKRQRLGAVRNSLRLFPLIACVVMTCFGTAASSYFVFVPVFVLVCVLGYVYFRIWRSYLLTRSHALLWILLPLFTLLLGVSTNPYPWPGIALTLAASVIVSWAALRWSPLMSAGLLVPLVAGPMIVLGLFMISDARIKQTNGLYWSEFNWPAVPRWRPLPAAESVLTGAGLVLCAGLVALTVVLFARRVIVRLRRSGRAVEPLDALLVQVRGFFS